MIISPQTLIAKKIAACLGSFCEVDEGMIRSRILNKSNISLKDVRVKPRVINEEGKGQAVEVIGLISEIVFRWKWDWSAMLPKKSTLQVKGVKIFMKPISAQEVAKMHTQTKISSLASLDSTISTDENKGETKEYEFVRKFLKTAVDKLAVVVEDLQLHLELPTVEGDPVPTSSKTITIIGQYIELEPSDEMRKKKKGHKKKKRKASDPLLQKLRIGSLSAHLITELISGKKTRLQMIDPFCYSALVRRVGGERFSSFHEGLVVEGEVLSISNRTSIMPILSSDSGEERDQPDSSFSSVKSTKGDIEIYANHHEEVVEATFNELLSNSWVEEQTYRPTESQEFGDGSHITPFNGRIKIHLGDPQTVALLSAFSIFTKEKTKDRPRLQRKNYGKGIMNSMRSFVTRPKLQPEMAQRGIVKASSFNFPFREFEVSLPNRAIISAQDCLLKYKADGTKVLLKGTGGVKVEQKDVLRPKSCWTVDMVKKTVVLHPRPFHLRPIANDAKPSSAPNGHSAKFEFGLEQIKQVSGGLSEISKLAAQISRFERPKKKSSRHPSWSLSLQGNTNITF